MLEGDVDVDDVDVDDVGIDVVVVAEDVEEVVAEDGEELGGGPKAGALPSSFPLTYLSLPAVTAVKLS